MAAIGCVFTISRVAEMLGEDEGWLHELSINMFPERGCLWILDAGDQETTAFTEYGVERLRETIDEEKRCGRAPKSGSATKSS